MVRFEVEGKPSACHAKTAGSYSVFLRTEGTEERLGFSVMLYSRVSETYSLKVEKRYLAKSFNDASTAQILSFFPFANLADGDRYKRNGIGSALLEQIMDDCRSGGIRLLYVVTEMPEMQAMLMKFGFENALKHLFYLDLLR